MLLAPLMLLMTTGTTAAPLARTPPMGWMSWQVFRCDVDCKSEPRNCIGEQLYQTTVDALRSDGYLAAGYDTIHIDDCWETKTPPRDAKGRLVPNATRFPSGFGGSAGLAEYCHSRGVKFGIYSDQGTKTCGGYPGSKGHEKVDADTFAAWGVDYLKEDGCYNVKSDYKQGYTAMGAALAASGRDIVYSCSWPAYLGSDESTKPFGDMIAAGCNLWRNWDDIQCSWDSLSGIIDHWGDWTVSLQKVAGPTHWNDPDMLLIGANRSGTQHPCLSDEEERTQMAIWSIVAAPLIMGNDARHIKPSSRAVLLNAAAIAINQDELGKQGGRLRGTNASDATQVWWRELSGGAVAVGLYNKWAPPPIPSGPCPTTWAQTNSSYYEASGGAAGNLGEFSGLSVAQAQAQCCANSSCAGFSYNTQQRSGFFKRDATAGIVHNIDYEGYTRPAQIPPTPGHGQPASITVRFADIGIGVGTEMEVHDVWSGQSLGKHTGSFTATDVGYHDTAFLRLVPVK